MSAALESMAEVRDRIVLLAAELEWLAEERERLLRRSASLNDEKAWAETCLYDESCDLLVKLADRALILSGNPSSTEVDERVDQTLTYLADITTSLTVMKRMLRAVHSPPGWPLALPIEEDG